MNHSDLGRQLLARLRTRGRSATALGIDLGTTKSSIACARFDARAGTLACECLAFPQAGGASGVAVPSAISAVEGRIEYGADALARRGQPRMLAERDLFYETKNLIGLRYTFSRAPKGLRTPVEVATQLLRHLREGIADAAARRAEPPIVIGVPASFHGAQRHATVRAGLAAFEAESPAAVRLIDEPYAAFVDLVFRNPERAGPVLRDGANVIVFDFGGGTCDVAIFRIDGTTGGMLGARLLGTSRYHRLGGGDIDRAIVHDVLIPALAAENGLKPHALTWFDKRRILEPQLLGAAERLKIALSDRLDALDALSAPARDDDGVGIPGITLFGRDREFTLSSPALSTLQFERLLRPFLDPDPPPEAGDEYVQRSSMLAPVAQALMRSRLEPDDIQAILLCGSSSLLAPVRAALRGKFPGAAHVLLGDAGALQGAVARGAALQALSLQALGEPLVAPVCSADLSLCVESGTVTLVRAGAAVPIASRQPTLLRPPRDNGDGATDIAVEIVADGQRLVGRSLWSLPPPVRVSDRLALDWSMDDNQCMELRLTRMDDPDTSPFVHRFDAPIMHRDPGQVVRCRQLEREEAIRNFEVPSSELGAACEQNARDCATLGEYEKALHFVGLAMQEQGKTTSLLNLRGIYRERIGDREGALESYRQAGECSTTHFNAGLLRYRTDDHASALVEVDAALELEPSRAGHALRGNILAKLGRQDEARVEWQDATTGVPDLASADDFELGWIETAARRLGDDALAKRARDARARLAAGTLTGTRAGELPALFAANPAPAERPAK